MERSLTSQKALLWEPLWAQEVVSQLDWPWLVLESSPTTLPPRERAPVVDDGNLQSTEEPFSEL